MKLLQLNVWEGRLIKNIMRLLESESPEILNLQELATTGDLKAFHWNPLDIIQNGLAYENVYFSPTIGWKLAELNVKFGNGILSRYPFEEKRTLWINGKYKPIVFMASGAPNVRNLQHVVIDIDGKKVNILNHHGYHLSNTKVGNSTTLNNMEKIKRYIESLSGPVIMSGDFNLNPQSDSIKVLSGLMHDLTQEYSVATTRNEFASRSTEICDFIFVNDEVEVQNFKVSERIVSDHAALILDFKIK